MILNWLLILIGLTALVSGAESLVRGASGIALLARMSPAVVGLTIVAAGTSMPELMVSVKASLSGNPGLAIGNVVGSNLLNIGMVLGITALFRPLRILGNTIRFEWPVLMLATLQFYLLARDGVIDRTEGLFLFGVMITFMAYAVWLGRQGIVEGTGEKLPTASFGRSGNPAIMFNILAIILGGGMLALGANTLVKGAVGVASELGISETIIGLTIVAVGTSAPELVTSVVAALRGQSDLAVGNVVGSSIFNLLAILGVAALFKPLPVPAEIMSRDIWWLIGITALMLPMMVSGKRVNRLEGFVLITAITAYIVSLILGS
ncbi:MAG: calcium/sodium antiporter [Spirochaetaceae bacterium]|nr:calcium/sodium antiporter [Spirochaetaceae bacterium]